MKNWIVLLLSLIVGTAYGDVKISNLPLGTGSATHINDSFPYVDSVSGITKRLTLFDIANVPLIAQTYAPLISPTFTGVLTLNGKLVQGVGTDSTTTGSNAEMATSTRSVVALTNASLASLKSIATTAVVDGYTLTLFNRTGAAITLVDGGTPSSGYAALGSGYGSNLTVPNNATVTYQYSSGLNKWMLRGGSYMVPLASGVSGILPKVNGGSGQDNSSLTFPASGVLVTETATETLTNKSISASSNTITNLTDSSISASAAIAHTKMAALTASMALVSDGSGIVAPSSVTSTELGYVSGATSSIQTQINTNATNISNLTTTVGTPTSAKTANAIVKRDASAGFVAGTVSGDVLALPTTTSSVGQVTLNGNRFLNGYNGNTILGDSAGNFTTTSSTTTAMGYQSMQAVSSGIGNTGVGYQALKSVTTGDGNAALGYQALMNSTGAGNVGIGNQAVKANTTGFNNVGIGKWSLINSTSGSQNTAVGATTLQQNISGDNNTAIGVVAMMNTQGGTSNTAIGDTAFRDLNGGSFNTCVGYFCGVTGTSANATTTGTKNSYFGYKAGQGTSTQLTRATAIGADATVSQDNSIAIGASGDKTGVGGIGAPVSTLHVNGAVQISDDTSTCNAAKAGAIRYNTNSVSYCNGSAWTAVGTGSGDSNNLLTNAGFETGSPATTSWALTAGTASNDTSTYVQGSQSLQLTLSAVSGAIIDQSVTPTATSGINFEHALWVKTSLTTLQVCALQASTEVNCQNVPSTDTWTLVNPIQAGPTSGSIGVRLKSTSSTTGIVKIDSAYLGVARSITQVSQARLLGKIRMSGCINWTRSNTAFGSQTATTGCSYVTEGLASAPSTQIPAIKLSSIPAGAIFVVARGVFGKNTSTTNADATFRFSDSTNTFGEQIAMGIASASGQSFGNGLLNGSYTYSTSQSNVTIEIQSKISTTTSGTGTFISTDGAVGANQINGLEIEVYSFPTSAQQAANMNTTPALWSGYHDSTCAWAVTSTSYADFTADASCSLVQRQASNITCSATGGVKPALSCTLPKTGTYKVCAVTGAWNNSASQLGQLKLWDGTTTIASAQETTTSFDSLTMCGLYSATNLNPTFSIQGKVQSGAINLGVGDETIDWTITDVSQSQPMPVLTGSVSASGTDLIRHEFALVTQSGGVYTLVRSSSGISSLTKNAAGDTTINFAANTFSSAPVCIYQGQESGNLLQNSGLPTTSGSRILSYTIGGATMESGYSVTCTGFR